MTMISIRNISEETHYALKVRAAKNNRSTEAEIISILDAVTLPPTRIKVGSELAAFGRRFEGINLNTSRENIPTYPVSFE